MNAPVPAPQAFFLAGASGQRLCLFHAPAAGAQRGRVLYLHPFAEELNTTRRSVAAQSRALAQAGFAVLQMDLQGCGDSAGDFADATWSGWLNDAEQGQHWLDAHASGPAWVWGLRSGALLACGLLERLQATGQEPVHLLFWQPVASGAQMLQQFLRLDSASQWLGEGPRQGPSAAQRLAQGECVSIAGYTLSPALAQGLTEARLRPPARATPARLVWLEVAPQADAVPSPAATQALGAWRAAGWHVQAHAVTGPVFWQNIGIEAGAALLHATQLALTAPAPNAWPAQGAPTP